MAVKRCRHGWMMFNTQDEFVGRSLDLYGEWGQSELTLLDHFLEPGAVVLDVGANIGTHTLRFAEQVGPEGMVIAFEPQRLSHQMLSGNVALNGLTNVVCVAAAVSDVPGVAHVPRLDPRKSANFGAVRMADEAGADDLDTVDAVTLDGIDLPSCRLIKVDVEGMERKVLAGARKTIERFGPALFLENNTLEGSTPLLHAVRDLGYAAYWHIAPYFHANNWFGVHENVFAAYRPEANILCVPKEVRIEGMVAANMDDDDWQRALLRAARGGL